MRNPFERILEERGSVVLDGGLATELERRGRPARPAVVGPRPRRGPERIREVHAAYFDAGADVAISSSYQATFEGLAGRGLGEAEAAALMRRSVELAREADPDGHVVAASVGPYGAMLGNGARYTGDYDRGEDESWRSTSPDGGARRGGARPVRDRDDPSIVEARALVRALERVPGRSRPG